MNHIDHPLDLRSIDDTFDLFAEEQELGELLQQCCYACASCAGSASCPASCASTLSSFSSECCDGS